jgi:catechol 2,3-dioxygenase-like lactoylglutathione lyase family enzyme
MARTLDHIVLCVDDLERARQSYRDLGFTLTPPAIHPFGTRNSLVQFAGRNFLELLALNDAAAIPPHDFPERFSFAAESAAFMRRHGEGMSMLVFAGDDAHADVAEFRAKGLTTYAPVDFGRDATLPDGSIARVGFSLAFVTDVAMPDVSFFTCQQRHAPELFWKSDYQAHANGAVRLTEIVLSAEVPRAHEAFLARLTGGVVGGDEAVMTVGDASDRITVMTPSRLAERFPELAGSGAGELPRFRAYRVEVGDLAVAEAVLRTNRVAHRKAGTSLVVARTVAHGVVVELQRRSFRMRVSPGTGSIGYECCRVAVGNPFSR